MLCLFRGSGEKMYMDSNIIQHNPTRATWICMKMAIKGPCKAIAGHKGTMDSRSRLKYRRKFCNVIHYVSPSFYHTKPPFAT